MLSPAYRDLLTLLDIPHARNSSLRAQGTSALACGFVSSGTGTSVGCIVLLILIGFRAGQINPTELRGYQIELLPFVNDFFAA